MKDKVLKCSECICITCIADCDKTLCKGYAGNEENRTRQQALSICQVKECYGYVGEYSK